MVMAAAPSAATGATGATGLERLLLIFLMKLSESQNAADDTYFSYDRLSDQSEKLCETPQETKEHRKPSKKTTTSPETLRTTDRAKELKLHQTNHAQTAGNLASPNKTRNERWKNANSPNETQTNSERWLHQHTTTQKLRKPPRTHAVDGSKF